MTRTIRLGALALGLLFSFTSLAAPVSSLVAFKPTPVEVPAELSDDATTRALARAFVMRSWRITHVDHGAGYVDAEYPIRVHIARVRARIDDGVVTFHYRDSEKIDHVWKVRTRELPEDEDPYGINDAKGWRVADAPRGPDSKELVHPKYLEWVENVSRTLEGTFRLEMLP